MSKRDQKNNIQDEVQMAVTIAAKSAEMDLNTPWLKELSSSCQIRPFVTKEFASIGWTLMFDREGSDLFDIKRLFNRV